MTMRSMPWDEEVWRKLKDAISPMPPSIRAKALEAIIAASEEFARSRGAKIVQEEDLLRAARERIPAADRQRMLEALAQQGLGRTYRR